MIKLKIHDGKMTIADTSFTSQGIKEFKNALGGKDEKDKEKKEISESDSEKS